jgi:hypothetical protein
MGQRSVTQVGVGFRASIQPTATLYLILLTYLSERTDNLGEGLTLTFRLRDKTTKVPIQDLQPHLGNWAYLVMIHRSSNLAREDYIYAYAIKGEMPGQLRVITRVPKPGQYKLWLQFRQNDRVLVAEFWLNFVKKLDLGN